MSIETPTASDLLAKIAEEIAKDQAERAAKYSEYFNEFEALLRNVALQKELRA